jgi:hypothetical protein
MNSLKIKIPPRQGRGKWTFYEGIMITDNKKT